MYYIEVLRTTRVYWRYLIVAGILYLIAGFFIAIFPHGGPGDTTRYSAGGHAAGVAFICLIFASIAGSSLSRHLDHLDFALTKPRDRTAFAADIFGVDLIGLTVFFFTTALIVFVFHVGLGEDHPLAFDTASWYGIVLSFGAVLAWYAIVQAISCDREAAGWALAVVWGTAIGLYIFGAFNLGPGLNVLITTLNFINPLAYLRTIPFEATTGATVSLVVHTFTIYLVAAAAGLVALIRWQRMEI